MSRKKPFSQIIDGVPAGPHCEPELFKESLRFHPREGDLVQMTFPKSGTHWVLYITQLILKRGEPITTYQNFLDEMRYLGIVDFKGWKPSLPLRIFSTHQPPQTVTVSEEAKYVYVARNPWDVCVSFFRMATSLNKYRFQDGTFDEFFEAFLEGDCAGHNYFDHVVSGYALRNEPNVFFVTYEELMADTRGTVLRLARFLGESYATELEQDEGMLQKLLERCSAGSMRSVLVFRTQHSNAGLEHAIESSDSSVKGEELPENSKYCLVREAKIGDWKTCFTPMQLQRIEDKITEVELNSSVMDLWRSIRDEAYVQSKK